MEAKFSVATVTSVFSLLTLCFPGCLSVAMVLDELLI